MTKAATRWYVVQTQPHAEMKVVAHLQRQGFESYLPVFLKTRRHARRTDTVRAALFPRYMFVAVDLAADRWRAIHSTVGVSRFLCNGDVPAPVPDGVVETIKRREDEQGYVTLDRRPMVPGDKVRVVDGAFSDCLGLFVGMTDNERVAILLDLLGRQIKVIIDSKLVTAA